MVILAVLASRWPGAHDSRSVDIGSADPQGATERAEGR